MDIKLKLALLILWIIGGQLSAQKCLKKDSFFVKSEAPIYCLEEVLSATVPVQALCVRRSDLMSFYGELSLVYSIMTHYSDSFAAKIKPVKNLYVYEYVPLEFIQWLAQNTSIEKVMFRPNSRSYTSQNLQNIGDYKYFEHLKYIECADTSLLVAKGLKQIVQLDTLVWLDIYTQNPYLHQVSSISTLILYQYAKKRLYNPAENWSYSSYDKPIVFSFPTQLQSIYIRRSFHVSFKNNINRIFYNRVYFLDQLNQPFPLATDSVVVKGENFPTPMPEVENLTLIQQLAGGEQRNRFVYTYVIPSDISKYINLKHLVIMSTNKIILPASFYQLTRLESLEISGYRYLSDSIRYLQSLKKMTLNNYNMRGVFNIPDSISCLSSLKQLRIYNRSERRETPLPSSIYELTNLEELDVSPYWLSDSIQYLQKLTKLTMAGILESEEVTRFPDGIRHLKALKELEIGMHYYLERFPNAIFELRQLERFVFEGELKRAGLNTRKLKQLTSLKYIEFDTELLKNEFHFKKIYQALPENCVLDLNLKKGFKAPEYWGNIGLYMNYGWGQTVFTGVEFLHYVSGASIQKKRDRTVDRLNQTINSEGAKVPRLFDFHTFSFGTEWNYLKNDDFLMGYRMGYNYTRIKEPISLQMDLMAYTNYKGAFDVRIAPGIAVPIRTPVLWFYVSYSYKMPLIAEQEQNIVARHNIGLNIRFTTDWWSSVLPMAYGF